MDTLPWKKLHELRDLVDLMHQTSLGIFDDAKRGLGKSEGSSEGKDDGRKDIISALSTSGSTVHISRSLTGYPAFSQGEHGRLRGR